MHLIKDYSALEFTDHGSKKQWAWKKFDWPHVFDGFIIVYYSTVQVLGALKHTMIRMVLSTWHCSQIATSYKGFYFYRSILDARHAAERTAAKANSAA